MAVYIGFQGHVYIACNKNMAEMNSDRPTAPAASVFWLWLQGRNSSAKSRKPPNMCIDKSNTRPNSAIFTIGFSANCKNESNRCGCVSASDNSQKCAGKNKASAKPESRCSMKASQSGCARAGAFIAMSRPLRRAPP